MCAGGGGRVSGQWLAGRGAVGLVSRSVPLSSLPLEVARAPLPHCRVGGGCGSGGPALLGGASRGTVPCPPPLLICLGLRGAAVTAVIACAGAGAAAVARSVGGSAHG